MSRFGLLLLAALLQTVAMADSSYLVPTEISEGEVAQLIIESDNPIATLPAIDTTPLERHFRVLDVASRVTRMLGEGGTPFHRAQWRIQITPKRVGRIEVPALGIGDRRSESLFLDVRPATALPGRHDVFVEVEASPIEPYLGQEIRVTTRVYHSSGFDWARLSEPQSEQVASYQHGGDRRYSIERDGREYRILERTQSLFPRRVGQLTLSEAEFRGRFGSGTGFDDRWLHRHSASPVLRVREPPVAIGNGAWLPARRVELEFEWLRPSEALEPGQPIDFTLTLTAEGLAAEFLPAGLLARAGDGFNTFADREQREDLLAGDALVGRLVQHYALVATRAGEILLPGIDLGWWDTSSDRPRRARVAPLSLTIVEPGVAAAEPVQAATSSLPLVSSGLVVVLGLLAGLLLYFWRGGRSAGNLSLWRDRRRCRRLLRRACRASDPVAARGALHDWLRLQPDTARSHALRAASRELDAALYARGAADWDGVALWRAVGEGPRAGKGGSDRYRLPALYPRAAAGTGADA